MIDWGTVPAWVGSVLTGGSLLLGFSILARDRRTAKAEHASALACSWLSDHPNSDFTWTHIEFNNQSSHYIRNLWIAVTPKWETLASDNWSRKQLLSFFQQGFFMKPSSTFHYWQEFGLFVSAEHVWEEWDSATQEWREFRPTNSEVAPAQRIRVPFRFPVAREHYDAYISFVDYKNQPWTRDLKTWKLSPIKITEAKLSARRRKRDSIHRDQYKDEPLDQRPGD